MQTFDPSDPARVKEKTVFDQILLELRLMNLLLAQRFGVTEELSTIRTDYDLFANL